MEYCQQRWQDSSTEDVTVKEDDFWKLMRSQDSDLAMLKYVIISGYDWEYLVEERICELAASLGVFIYRFIFFTFPFYFYFYIEFYFLRILFRLKIAVQQVLESPSLLDHEAVAKIEC
jgi:hypothetical protein